MQKKHDTHKQLVWHNSNSLLCVNIEPDNIPVPCTIQQFIVY